MNNIKDKIKEDINEEFKKLNIRFKNKMNSCQDLTNQNYSWKESLKKNTLELSKLLYDTVINYLMTDARNKLKDKDTKIQNSFFEKNFRELLSSWVSKEENNLRLEFNGQKSIKSKNISNKLRILLNSVVISGLAFLIVSCFYDIIFVSISIILAILLLYIINSMYIKMKLEKKENSNLLNVDEYLIQYKKQATTWIFNCIDYFEINLSNFYNDNKLDIHELYR